MCIRDSSYTVLRSPVFLKFLSIFGGVTGTAYFCFTSVLISSGRQQHADNLLQFCRSFITSYSFLTSVRTYWPIRHLNICYKRQVRLSLHTSNDDNALQNIKYDWPKGSCNFNVYFYFFKFLIIHRPRGKNVHLPVSSTLETTSLEL